MPSAAAAKKKTDPYRRALYGKIEIAKKELGLEDEDYRATLQRLFGKTSRTQLGNAQLVDLVEHFKSLGWKAKARTPKRAGGRALADNPTAKKARALWLSLYHLGCVSEPSESALAAFVKRQAGVDDLRFLTDERSVVEALKAWAARPVEKGGGGVSWSGYAVWVPGAGPATIDKPRARVMEAQWRILHALGEVKIKDTGALEGWVAKFLKQATGYVHLEPADADRCIEQLGAWIRRAKGADS